MTPHKPSCRLSRLPPGNDNHFFSASYYVLIIILTCHNPCSGQAKPNKKAKVTKPTTAPEVAEPEQQISAPEASDKQPDETVTDAPPEIPDPFVDDTTIDPSNSRNI